MIIIVHHVIYWLITTCFNVVLVLTPTPGVLLSLRYLDDGTIIGSRPAVLELLHHIETLGPSFGLFLNKRKCKLYWPAGDQSFSDFPSEIRRPSAGLDLLGSPV